MSFTYHICISYFFCHAKQIEQGFPSSEQGFPSSLWFTKKLCTWKLERMNENGEKHSVQVIVSCFDAQKCPEDAEILVLCCSVAREHTASKLLSACSVDLILFLLPSLARLSKAYHSLWQHSYLLFEQFTVRIIFLWLPTNPFPRTYVKYLTGCSM